MKLLFDENLSFKIAKSIQDLFPGSTHVSALIPEGSDDMADWKVARENHFTIVTQDSDFVDLAAVRGVPPKIIWLRTGNTSTLRLINCIRKHAEDISSFLNEEKLHFLAIK